ncbi:hypothetical protein SLEP1_g53583 [Rubroshorea leprosula]|uniref:AAA+ ATPase At3g28540-like C-terminal domain-containing protein n=1 Tax=Rubroshorea leprosula TaxID=152421 RepID=A0AAV5MAB6_9ROSI|nr:hypothetical protein SLEP1_g53583 [Rubroshorea leprosula]
MFTTNRVEQLDPALIRGGRMDMHIESGLKSCSDKTNMTSADIAENLMLKTSGADAETCLKLLIQALEKTKEEQESEKKEGGYIGEEKEETGETKIEIK